LTKKILTLYQKGVLIAFMIFIITIVIPVSSENSTQNSEGAPNSRTIYLDKNIEYLCPSPPITIVDGAWRPDGSYSILVGSGIYIFDGENCELLNLNNEFKCVAWKPDNDLTNGYQGYALLAGYSLLIFDGSKLIELTVEIPDQKYISEIAWKPDGSYALLFGSSYYNDQEVLLKYDGENLIDLTLKMGTSPRLYGLCWHPNGNYAIIVGTIYSYNPETDSNYSPAIIKYDGTDFFELSNMCDFPGILYDISWKPNDDYALIIGLDYDEYSSNTPMIIQFNGSGFNLKFIDLEIVNRLNQITWHPKDGYALITGDGGQGDFIIKYYNQNIIWLTSEYGIYQTWLYQIFWHPYQDYAIIPFDKWLYIGLYKLEDDKLSIISNYMMDCESGPISISWKPDGSYALIVGYQYFEYRRGGRPSYYHHGRLWKFDGTNLTNLTYMLPTNEILLKCSWQPNSSKAFISSYGTLLEYNEKEIIDISNKIGNPETINDIEWNPSGNKALILTSKFNMDTYPHSYSGKIWEYDATIDNWTLLISNSSWYYKNIAWHPSGSRAIISSASNYDQCLIQYNNTDFITIEIDSDPLDIIDMEWKPDGSELAIIGNYDSWGVVLLYDGIIFTVAIPWTDKIYYLTDLSWEPNGNFALISSTWGVYRWENNQLINLKTDQSGTSTDSIVWYPQDGINQELKGSSYFVQQCGKILRYGNIKPKLITDFPIRKVESGQISYEFITHYIDLENDVPATGYPKLNVYRDSDGTIPYSGSPFIMTALDNTDNIIVDGKTFVKNLSLLENNFNYSFQIEVKAASGDTTPVYSRLILFSELDFDGDSYNNDIDQFPYDQSEWKDSDGDSYGDNIDEFPDDPFEWKDTDGDGFGDNTDQFPEDSSEWIDSDGDGFGDNSDEFPDDPSEWLDSDDDGYGDNFDKFPYNGSEWNDTDGDGIGDNSDFDDDNDGYIDELELADGTDPLNNNSIPEDYDNDLIPDSIDSDDDNDGYNDSLEKVEGTNPLNPNSIPADLDQDFLPDTIDPDIDGDNVSNEEDEYPFDTSKSEPEEDADYIGILYSITGIVILTILSIVLFFFVKKQKKEKKDLENKLSTRISLEPKDIPQETNVKQSAPPQPKLSEVKTQPTIKKK
jgi:hypothetical protein